IANHAETDAMLMQTRNFALECAHEQLHQERNFLDRATPVFGTEGKERQLLDLILHALADDSADGFHTTAVPRHTGQMALPRPTAVAVHDHGDMTRHIPDLRYVSCRARI